MPIVTVPVTFQGEVTLVIDQELTEDERDSLKDVAEALALGRVQAVLEEGKPGWALNNLLAVSPELEGTIRKIWEALKNMEVEGDWQKTDLQRITVEE